MAQNLLKLGIDKEDILKMGTLNPAKLIDAQNVGDIKIGYFADLNILNDNLNIISTVFRGEILRY